MNDVACTTTTASTHAPRNNSPPSLRWQVDTITVESTPLTTTGGHTWQAARHLAAYLEHCYATDTHAMRTQPLRVLELGAGCGWLGTVFATNVPTAEVCVTEQETGGALDWLRHNVTRAGLPNLWAAPCDWTLARACTAAHIAGPCDDACNPGNDAARDAECDAANCHAAAPHHSPLAQPRDDVLTQQWDLVIGSDLVYNEAGTHWLPRVLAALLQRHAPCVLYCHTKHRYDLLDVEFFAQLETCGVAWEEVWDPAQDPPPDSPPLVWPGELFGEQRIAVLKLTRAR